MAEYFTKKGDEFVKVDGRLYGQEDFDGTIAERLERERKKYSDYDDLKGKVTTLTEQLTETSKTLDSTKSEYEGKLKKATLDTEKVKIIGEFKLSDDLADFVTGDNAEEMRARAEKLAKNARTGTIVINKDQKPDVKSSDSKAIAGKLFGKKSDD